VRLELAGILLCQLFGIHISFRIWLLNLVAFFVNSFRPWLRRWRSDVEHFRASDVANRVAIEDVASVLAIILAQSPSDSLAHHLLRDPLLVGVFLIVLVYLKFELKRLVLVI